MSEKSLTNIKFGQLVVPAIYLYHSPGPKAEIKLQCHLSANIYRDLNLLVLMVELDTEEDNENFKLSFVGKLDFKFAEVTEEKTFKFLINEALPFSIPKIQTYLDNLAQLNSMPKFIIPALDYELLAKDLVENTRFTEHE